MHGNSTVAIIGTIIWIVCLVLNIVIAQKKNRPRVWAWIVLSIFFSWIILIINLVKKPD